MVCLTAVNGKRMMQDDGAATYFDGSLFEDRDTSILHYAQRVAYYARRCVRKHAEFVGAGDIADASVLNCRIVERDPGADQFVGLEWPIRHVLMRRHDGSHTRRFRKHLAAIET